MKQVLIQVFQPSGKKTKMIVCDHIDCTKNLTVLYNAIQQASEPIDRATISEKFERVNIEPGRVTIFYESGTFLEITRLHD